MASITCPACLSTVEASDARCTECGAPLRTRTRRLGIILGSVACIAAAGAWAILGREDAPGTREPVRTATPDQASRSASEPEPEPPPASAPGHHWELHGEDLGTTVWALVIRGEGGPPILFAPLAGLPVRGTLQDRSGNEVPVRVLNYDLEREFALLSPLTALPDQVQPVAVGPSTALVQDTPLTVLATDGQRHRANLLGRTPGGGRLQIDSDMKPGDAVVFQGAAIAYAVSTGEALPLDYARPWLGHTGGREFGEVQAELRQLMPEHVLADSAALLQADATVDDVRRALELLEGILPRVDERHRDRLADLVRDANQRMVRLLAPTDPAAALRFARDALPRLPDQNGLLGDAAVLSIAAGSPHEALQHYLQLRMQSREHATRVADTFVTGLVRLARRWIEEGRIQGTIDLLEETVAMFSSRADLRATYAAALAAAGRLDDAIAEASLAAQQEPTLRSVVEEYRQRAARAGQEGVAEIPVDPATLSIRAEVRVAGKPIELVVDTGASLTTIPSQMARELGLWSPTLPRAQVETAAGPIEAPVVELPELSIGSIRVERVRAVVLDLSGHLAGKGLLGLNVLQRLNMRLDSGSGRLLLERPPSGGR